MKKASIFFFILLCAAAPLASNSSIDYMAPFFIPDVLVPIYGNASLPTLQNCTPVQPAPINVSSSNGTIPDSTNATANATNPVPPAQNVSNYTGNATAPLQPLNASSNATNATIPSPQANCTPAQAGNYSDFLNHTSIKANFTILNFTFKNSSAHAIVSLGEVRAIIAPSQSHMLEPITNQAELESAIYALYLSLGLSPNSTDEFSSVHENLTSLSQKRSSGESECRRLLGTDHFECASYDSCQKACYSVTSFCIRFALGIGRDFVNEVWAFENNTFYLDQAYEREQAAYAQFRANSTRESALSYLSSLKDINRAATRSASSMLYSDYSFCFSPEYGLRNITALQTRAELAWRNASYFYSLGDTAGRALEHTAGGLVRMRAYEASRPALANKPDAPKPNASALNNSSQIPARQNQSPPSQLPPEQKPKDYLDAAVASFAAVFTLLALFAGLAFYRFARKKKPEKKPALQQKPVEKKK
jgi:hypothetical protein